MKVYFDEDDLDGQFQRTLTHAYERGADLGECFATAERIAPGDDASWHDEWTAAAETARASAEKSLAAGQIESATEAFLRASEYQRQAMFFLRGDLDDPRVKESYIEMRDCFRRAIPGLPNDVEPVRIPYEGTSLNGYLITPSGESGPWPTVLFPAGYDSVAEEGLLYGAPAIRRGYAVLSFEGPGQGGVLYEQRLHLRPDFEAVLTPVVDFALTRREVDPDRLVLFGRSFAGYLAPRGATEEHRIAALVCDPGQVDLGARVRERTPATVLELIRANDPKVDELIASMLASAEMRRAWLPRMAAHGTPTLREYMRVLLDFTLEDAANAISCPTLVTEGEGDFAGGQAKRLYDLLACPKEYRFFTAAEGTSGHMEGLGQLIWSEYVFDWLASTLA